MFHVGNGLFGCVALFDLSPLHVTCTLPEVQLSIFILLLQIFFEYMHPIVREI